MCKTQMRFQWRKCFHPARQVTTSSRSSKKNSQLTCSSEWCLFRVPVSERLLDSVFEESVGSSGKNVGFFFFSVCVCACVSVCQMCITAAAWLQSCWCNNCSSKWIMVSVNKAIRPFGFCFPVFLSELMQCLFLTWVLQQVTTKTIINTCGESQSRSQKNVIVP